MTGVTDTFPPGHTRVTVGSGHNSVTVSKTSHSFLSRSPRTPTASNLAPAGRDRILRYIDRIETARVQSMHMQAGPPVNMLNVDVLLDAREVSVALTRTVLVMVMRRGQLPTRPPIGC